MKVTLLQTDIQWAQADKNILEAERMIAEHPGSDLYAREPRPLPKMIINPDVKNLFDFTFEDFQLEGKGIRGSERNGTYRCDHDKVFS